MGEPICAQDRQRLEDTATYLVRNPLSLKKLVYLDGQQVSIRQILDHLGLITPEQDKPPPGREILRVAEQGQGWGVPAEWD